MPSSNRSGSSSHYHRFIPSEEVQDVAAWEFAPVGDTAIEHKQPGKAGKPTEPEVPDAEQLQALLQQARAEGFEQGRLAGAKDTRDALEAQMKRQIQEISQRVILVFQKAKSEQTALEQSFASELLLLACDIARQVIRQELSTSIEPLKAVVQEALSIAIEDGRAGTLKLHPSDADILLPAIEETLKGLHVQIVTSDALQPGDCVVETAHGVVDGTVERRWRKAVANLGLSLDWQTQGMSDV